MPTSRTRFFARLAPFDLFWAAASPLAAFLIRDGTIYRVDGVAIYCAISVVASVMAFQWFKTSSPIASYFSMRDAFALAQASLTAVAFTAVFLFVFTRLEDAPRSVPIIHLFVLLGGLIAQRAMSRLQAGQNAAREAAVSGGEYESVIVIEATPLAWFFSRMLDELSTGEARIVGVLDQRAWLTNRSLNGYPILGEPKNLSRIVDEFATHGVEVHRVVVATPTASLSAETLEEIREACDARGIRLEWLHEQFFQNRPSGTSSMKLGLAETHRVPVIDDSSYWSVKRLLDIAAALAAMIALAPLTLAVAVVVLLDVGSPTVFWQQRVGRFGRPLHIYKFRTMRASFDRQGRPVPETERLSGVGRALRRNRLDEIPQLFNVLTGSMSLVGPRPLLAMDQPKLIRLRLQARPGLTGLAQINGGKLLSPEEKDALDEWYVLHASFALDLRILLRTIWVILRGDRRNETAIRSAMTERQMRRCDEQAPSAP